MAETTPLTTRLLGQKTSQLDATPEPFSGAELVRVSVPGDKDFKISLSRLLGGGGGGSTTIIDNLESSRNDAALAASQGPVIKGLIDTKAAQTALDAVQLQINSLDVSGVTGLQAELTGLQNGLAQLQAVLTSDNVNLDSVQEIVDWIEANRDTLDTLGIDSILGLRAALDALANDISTLQGDVETERTRNNQQDTLLTSQGNAITTLQTTTASQATAIADLQNAGYKAIEFLTQAEYDALVTPDPQTLYCIIDPA